MDTAEPEDLLRELCDGRYSELLHPDFDPVSFSAAALQDNPIIRSGSGCGDIDSKTEPPEVGEIERELDVMMTWERRLRGAIRKVVGDGGRAFLHHRANAVADLSSASVELGGGVTLLRTGVEKLNRQVGEPHEALELHVRQLERVLNVTSSLRQVGRVLATQRRLQALMARVSSVRATAAAAAVVSSPGVVDGPPPASLRLSLSRDLVKAATCLAELEPLIKDAELVGIVAVASGWGSVIESGKVVRAEALLGLQAALLVEDQSDSEIFLQVFVILRMLPEAVIRLLGALAGDILRCDIHSALFSYSEEDEHEVLENSQIAASTQPGKSTVLYSAPVTSSKAAPSGRPRVDARTTLRSRMEAVVSALSVRSSGFFTLQRALIMMRMRLCGHSAGPHEQAPSHVSGRTVPAAPSVKVYQQLFKEFDEKLRTAATAAAIEASEASNGARLAGEAVAVYAPESLSPCLLPLALFWIQATEALRQEFLLALGNNGVDRSLHDNALEPLMSSSMVSAPALAIANVLPALPILSPSKASSSIAHNRTPAAVSSTASAAVIADLPFTRELLIRSTWRLAIAATVSCQYELGIEGSVVDSERRVFCRACCYDAMEASENKDANYSASLLFAAGFVDREHVILVTEGASFSQLHSCGVTFAEFGSFDSSMQVSQTFLLSPASIFDSVLLRPLLRALGAIQRPFLAAALHRLVRPVRDMFPPTSAGFAPSLPSRGDLNAFVSAASSEIAACTPAGAYGVADAALAARIFRGAIVRAVSLIVSKLVPMAIKGKEAFAFSAGNGYARTSAQASNASLLLLVLHLRGALLSLLLQAQAALLPQGCTEREAESVGGSGLTFLCRGPEADEEGESAGAALTAAMVAVSTAVTSLDELGFTVSSLYFGAAASACERTLSLLHAESFAFAVPTVSVAGGRSTFAATNDPGASASSSSAALSELEATLLLLHKEHFARLIVSSPFQSATAVASILAAAGAEAAAAVAGSVAGDKSGQNEERVKLEAGILADRRDFELKDIYRRLHVLLASEPFVVTVSRDFASRLISSYTRHAALLRPVSEAGKLRIARDGAQLLSALSSFTKAEHLEAAAELKSFKTLMFSVMPLLTASSTCGPNFGVLGEALYRVRPSTVWHLVLSLGPIELPSPHQVLRCTPGRYVEWLESDSVGDISESLLDSSEAKALVNTLSSHLASPQPLISEWVDTAPNVKSTTVIASSRSLTSKLEPNLLSSSRRAHFRNAMKSEAVAWAVVRACLEAYAQRVSAKVSSTTNLSSPGMVSGPSTLHPIYFLLLEQGPGLLSDYERRIMS